MPLITAQYHYLECGERVDNVLDTTCGARSPGQWHDKDAMEAGALELGWARHGKDFRCPAHSTVVEEPAKPARQRVKSVEIAPPATEHVA